VPESRILLGVIGRPHGVRGWVRVTSFAEDLTAYGPLLDDKERRFVLRWRGEGVAEIAEVVAGAEVKVADRTAAEKLVNLRLYVERDRLPEPDEDEFYLADLIGLAARDTRDAVLGRVVAVHDYGAGASLEIARENGPPLLVPFSRASVPVVDLAGAFIVLEPPAEVDMSQTPPPRAGGGCGEGAPEPGHSPFPPTPSRTGRADRKSADRAPRPGGGT
jgi:16S rRNA processing protein RimM